MKKIVGVMGPSEKQATEKDLELALEVGKLVAKNDLALLCGGMSGTMEASAKGAKSIGGLTIGIGPKEDKEDMNAYIDVPLVTGMHSGRNFINVISSDILLFVSVDSLGTLSELAFSIQTEKPSIVINGSEKLESYINEISNNTVVFVSSLGELEVKLKKVLETL